MTQEERDNLLVGLVQSVNDIKQDVKEMDTRLTKEIGEIRQEMEEMDSRLTKEIGEIRQQMEEMDSRLTKELERQRMNMARMENELTDKIDALFDARQISLEKAETFENGFKSIEDILDNHNMRISVLESKLG